MIVPCWHQPAGILFDGYPAIAVNSELEGQALETASTKTLREAQLIAPKNRRRRSDKNKGEAPLNIKKSPIGENLFSTAIPIIPSLTWREWWL